MLEPTRNDVLAGRGASFNQHPGNENFRRMIEKQKVRRRRSFVVNLVLIVHLTTTNIKFARSHLSSNFHTIQTTNAPVIVISFFLKGRLPNVQQEAKDDDIKENCRSYLLDESPRQIPQAVPYN